MNKNLLSIIGAGLIFLGSASEVGAKPRVKTSGRTKPVPKVVHRSNKTYPVSQPEIVPVLSYLSETKTEAKPQIRLDWQELSCRTPKSLEEISGYMGAVKYYNRGGNDWKSPKQTVEDGVGLCRDTSVLGAYLAEKMGYRPQVLELLRKDGVHGHAITLIESETRNGKVYGAVDSHNNIYKLEYKSVYELLLAVNQRHSEDFVDAKVIDLSNAPGEWKTSSGNISGLMSSDKRFEVSRSNWKIPFGVGCGLFALLYGANKFQKRKEEEK